jgi:hypothetical protein
MADAIAALAAGSSHREKHTETNPGGELMSTYFYKWIPLVIVGAVVLLSLPWLGLIALIIVALVALPALAFAIVYVPYLLIRAIGRSWQGQSGGTARTPAAQPAFRKGSVS